MKRNTKLAIGAGVLITIVIFYTLGRPSGNIVQTPTANTADAEPDVPVPVIKSAYASLENAVNTPPVVAGTTRKSFTIDRLELFPKGEFEMTGRVLGSGPLHLYSKDNMWDFAPRNFALGWGIMAEDKNKNAVLFKPHDRFLEVSFEETDLSSDDIRGHLALDVIMIPANDAVKDALMQVDINNIIRVKGPIVDVYNPGNWRMDTSLMPVDPKKLTNTYLWVESIQIDKSH